MFALIDEESDCLLGRIGRLRGFFVGTGEGFVDPDGVGKSVRTQIDFHAVGVDVQGISRPEFSVRREPRNLILQVISADGQPIGEYYVASATWRRLNDSDADNANLNVLGYVDWIPHHKASEVWRSWAESLPVEPGLWAALPLGDREAWLEVAGLYRPSPESGSRGPRPASDYYIDGSNIEDLASFFCAVGEAVNGPGGYFGWNISALADCLRGEFGARPPFVLNWSNFDVARRALGDEVAARNAPTSYLNLILDLFEEMGVEVRIEST